MVALIQDLEFNPAGYLPDYSPAPTHIKQTKKKPLKRVMAMNKLPLITSLTLAAGFLFFGVQKFGAENIVFDTIAQRSGISLFEPYIRYFTGLAELGVAALLLMPRTRLFGTFAGLGLLLGAIGFHLSPWLGINVPTIGHGLFFTALAMTALTFLNAALLRKSGAILFFWQRKQAL